MKPLTQKELNELDRLQKKIFRGKASRKEINRAIDLRHRDNKTANQ